MLRIRSQGASVPALFTVKRHESNPLDRTEAECGIDDPEKLKEILAMLGFQWQLTVEKQRRTGKWREITVCIDEVSDLGMFIEFEVLTSESAMSQEILWRELSSLGIEQVDRVQLPYDQMLAANLHVNENTSPVHP